MTCQRAQPTARNNIPNIFRTINEKTVARSAATVCRIGVETRSKTLSPEQRPIGVGHRLSGLSVRTPSVRLQSPRFPRDFDDPPRIDFNARRA
jgi:hypothetical protein